MKWYPAPAKLNLFLHVLGRRQGGEHAGYHELQTVFRLIDRADRVGIAPREDGEIGFSGPLGEDNLVVRAARLLAGHTGHTAGVHLEITKRVPVAGGMGGGSADAAATLVACNALWGTGLTREELGRLGARLGADVPFALSGGAAVGLGVGDELSPLLLRNRTDWVLVPASYGLSTPAVYRRLDELRAGQEVETPREVDPELVQALLAGDHALLPALVANELQPAAISLAPELEPVLRMGDNAGALAAIVSGSGPTVALLAADAGHARQLATQLQDEAGVDALGVHGPVSGAVLL